MNIKPPFRVKCVDTKSRWLTAGEEYVVIEVDDCFYVVRNDFGIKSWYCDRLFEIVETPKDKQEFSVGDKVVINKISDWYVSSADKNVKVGDVATVTILASGGEYDVRLTNQSWRNDWWFSKADVSLVADNNPLDDKSRDYHPLTHQEVIQAIIDGKELEIQYTDETWHSFSTHSTTLHQFINLKFRLKPKLSLEDKRKAVIKKLLETKVAVLCKCWDDDIDDNVVVAIINVDDDFVHSYLTDISRYENAYAIDDNGNEITNVE